MRAQAQRLREHAQRHPDLDIADIAFSLGSKPVLEDRAVVQGHSREELLSRLDRLSHGETDPGLITGLTDRDRPGGTVWVFPGQGSQWSGMSVDLLGCSRVFAGSMEACADALAPFVDWVLLDVLRGVDGAPGLDRVDVVQPVLFAVMVSLAALWRASGVRPAAVVGHSQGEIAAAHVAGGLSLEDAARIVALRSKALIMLAGHGGMVSVSASVEMITGLLEREGDDSLGEGSLAIAAVNGPSSIVVSGDTQALQRFLQTCEQENIRARTIPVDYAAHSSHVDGVRDELLEGLGGVSPSSGEVPFFSTVTGGLLDMVELDAEYWYRNLRERVQLEGVVRGLLADGRWLFIEVSPHPVLTAGVQETVDECVEDPGRVHVTGSLRRGEGGVERFLRSLADAWTHGVGVDWQAVTRTPGTRLVSLPGYAFQRKRFWLDAGSDGGGVRAAGFVWLSMGCWVRR